MTKKLLLSAFSIALSAGVAFAQCTPPDPNTTAPGFYPEPGSPLAHGESGMAYSQVFTFEVPSDTTVDFQGFPVDASIDSISIDDITGLPAGLSFDCSNADCFYDAMETGCIDVSGTITDPDGTYGITVMVTFYGTALGGSVATEQAGSLPFGEYDIVVGDVSIEEGLKLNKFDLVQNYPNPFDKSTLISFSSDANKTVDFTVYNVLGEKVKEQKIDAKRGLNQFEFISEYPSGVYIYSLNDGEKTLTKRMIIK